MSTEYEYIPITHDELPCEKIFTLDGTDYALEFRFNDVADFYTLSVSDEDGDLLFTTKLTYLTEAIDAVIEGIDMTRNIVPAQFADIDADEPTDTQVTKNTFDEVYLCLI